MRTVAVEKVWIGRGGGRAARSYADFGPFIWLETPKIKYGAHVKLRFEIFLFLLRTFFVFQFCSKSQKAGWYTLPRRHPCIVLRVDY